jgi:membrane protein
LTARILRPATRIGADALRRFLVHDGLVLSGYLAYLALLSLMPFLVFLVALIGMFGASEAGSALAAFLLGSLPPEAAPTLEMPIVEIFQEPRGDLLTVGIVGAVWVAATGVGGLRHALNRVGADLGRRRPIWRSRLESMVIVLGFGLVMLAIALILVLTPAIAPGAARLFDLSTAWIEAWGFGRYVLAGMVMFAVSAVLYHVLPDFRPRLRDTLPGAALVVALFLAGSGLFSLYVAHVADYAALYGGLGGIVVTLTFFFAVGAIFILGGCVNAAACADQARERAR